MGLATPVTKPITVTEILPSLVDSFDAVGTGEFLRFTVAGRMQRRARSAGVMKAVEAAKLRKASTHQPFWDALFDEVAALPPHDVAEVLQLARFHQAMEDVATRIPFALDGQSVLDCMDASRSIPTTNILALSSKLKIASGEELHIPMLDYRVPITPQNDSLIVAQLTEIGASGWLLASGRSYHFLGDTLLRGARGLAGFLGRALLYSPIVDGRWIAHQLVEGACALRVSSGDPSQIVPTLVTRVTFD